MPKGSKRNNSGKNNPNHKYSDEELIQEANKYKIKTEFSKNNPRMYRAAYRRNLLYLCNLPENASIGRPCPWKIWVKETIAVEALKYQKRKEFQKGSSGAYDAARDLGILDEVCSHMDEKYHHFVTRKRIV